MVLERSSAIAESRDGESDRQRKIAGKDEKLSGHKQISGLCDQMAELLSLVVSVLVDPLAFRIITHIFCTPTQCSLLQYPITIDHHRILTMAISLIADQHLLLSSLNPSGCYAHILAPQVSLPTSGNE